MSGRSGASQEGRHLAVRRPSGLRGCDWNAAIRSAAGLMSAFDPLRTLAADRSLTPMRYVDAYSDAAAALGIVLRGPVDIDLPYGKRVRSPMLIQHFGAPKGTLVFPSVWDALNHSEALRELGYAASSFAEPLARAEVWHLRDMLLDWGWCGDESLRPGWA